MTRAVQIALAAAAAFFIATVVAITWGEVVRDHVWPTWGGYTLLFCVISLLIAAVAHRFRS